MVGLGIFLCIPYSGRNDFNPQRPFCFLRHEQGDGPGAAIQIDYRFLPFQIRKIQGRIIQLFRLFAVHLEKRLGRNIEFQGTDLILNCGVTCNQPGFLA